jgi:galactofuranose transport system permease protein
MSNPTPRPAEHRLAKLIWPSVALFLLLAINLIKVSDGHVSFSVDFFRIVVKNGYFYGSLIDVLNRAAPVLLTSLGMTLVIATGGVDLSVGAVMAIAGSVAAWLITDVHLGLAPVIAISLAICLAAGAWNGVLVAFAGVQPIVATLVLMVAGRGIAQLITEGQIPTLETALPAFGLIGGGHLFALPVPVNLVVIMFLLTGVLARRSALGLFIEAVGGNETASRYAGVNARAVKLFAYAFCGLCSGLAGLIVASDIRAADANNAGLYLELDAILAVVIGGTALTGGRFSLLGTILGALIIQTLTTSILTRGVPVEFTLVVKALVVLAVCLLQSERFQAVLLRRRTAA